MLTLFEVTYRINRDRALLDRASAQIPEGAKVGLVGRNGVGKSTLLDLDLRRAAAGGRRDQELPRGHRIGFLAQQAPNGAAKRVRNGSCRRPGAHLAYWPNAKNARRPLRAAEIETRLVEIDAYSAPSRAGRILAGLGFDDALQSSSRSHSLSGGWRDAWWRWRQSCSPNLDLLLLDEPTNHLDLEASLWLERFLRFYRRTLILVSHDRSGLNAV